MQTNAYYNDNEKFVIKWLKELIKSDQLPPGDVDDRPIQEIKPEDLRGYTQHHFFAGIGGWPYALRLSGWNANRPVWTGSCPCQSLSVAGKGLGEKDERHLWPVWYGLIEKLRPATVFGEQVASKDGREWLSGVRNDLEAVGYAVGAADLPAASVGSPHRRNRLFWVGHASVQGLEGHGDKHQLPKGDRPENIGVHGSNGFWHNSIAIPCADGKWRRVPGGVADSEKGNGSREVQEQSGESRVGLQGMPDRGCSSQCRSSQHQYEIKPTLFPLADGLPGRVGLLRGAGNAIVPQVAAEFIKAYMEI